MRADDATRLTAPASGIDAADPRGYKDAVIYELHIKAFCDANGDGIGDFEGLIGKLDYVRDLGVNTIWLLPFYPSPFRDDGYDVADFMDVNPAYGSVADVGRLVREAHARGLRVITELVVNHTSDQHQWFQTARRAPRGSAERDFYVWSDDPKRYAGTRIIFTDTETSNWSWDEVAGQYFWHRFFSHQPDLNFDNPRVREAVFGVMEFWLDQGVDGFRLDAIPYLIEREGTSNENLRETHEVIKELRRRLDAKYQNKLLLAEANMWPEDVREYFGEEDECHMAYHFPLMPRMYMAIAQEDRHPVVEILAQTPEIPDNCQWAIFLRNHDELTLEMVTSKERDYMYSMYAAEPRARINLGIRRRLAPLLENDRERIKLMNSLLLSMPGSPVLYYGDEIGMGDNIFLGDRDGVRTPMQWTSDRNGGFSRADPQRLYLPPIQDPVYGFEAVNVEAESRDHSSLLNWTRRMLATRRSTHVFGRGRITMLHPGNRKILAYLRELGNEAVLCVANLGRSAQPVELELGRFKGRVPVEMSGHIPFPPIGDLPYPLTLAGHGFFWFRLAADAAPPDWHTHRLPAEDLAVLVLFDGWNSLFRERVVPWRIAMATKTLAQFEGDLLPRFLERQRWFGSAPTNAPASDPASAALVRVPVRLPVRVPVRVADHAVLVQGGREWLLALVETSGAGETLRWFTPFALGWEDGEDEHLRQLAPAALAKVRTQARVGVLADAMADEAFVHALVQAIGTGLELRLAQGRIRFVPTRAFASITAGDAAAWGPLNVPPQGRHSTVILGERVFLKLLRLVQPGVHPEVELGRFLHEVAGYTGGVPLAGSVEHVAADGSVSTLAVLQGCVPNQGSVWTLAVEHLSRELERVSSAGADVPGETAGAASGFVVAARTLARRIARLHAALARPSGNAAFDPEPIGAVDLQRWAARTSSLATETLARLRDATKALAIEQIIERAAASAPVGNKTRIHGNLRLQELLLVNNDFVVIDFEGDTTRPLAERCSKESPLRDVAAVLHSITMACYAALQIGTHVEPEQLRRQALMQAWAASVREAFLVAYAATAREAGLQLDSEDLVAHQPMLALFELDAALHELNGELMQPGAASAAPLAHLPALAALAALATLTTLVQA